MITFEFARPNWLGIAVVAFVAFMLGGAWYTALFGKIWVRLQGWSEAEVKERQAKMSPAKFFGGMLICYFIVAFGVDALIQMSGMQVALQGALLGFILWLIVTAVRMTDHLASGKHLGLYLIDSAFQLIFLVGMGATLGGWK